jgi:hypothetical protein
MSEIIPWEKLEDQYAPHSTARSEHLQSPSGWRTEPFASNKGWV